MGAGRQGLEGALAFVVVTIVMRFIRWSWGGVFGRLMISK
jgi:hypothetical protein